MLSNQHSNNKGQKWSQATFFVTYCRKNFARWPREILPAWLLRRIGKIPCCKKLKDFWVSRNDLAFLEKHVNLIGVSRDLCLIKNFLRFYDLHGGRREYVITIACMIGKSRMKGEKVVTNLVPYGPEKPRSGMVKMASTNQVWSQKKKLGSKLIKIFQTQTNSI